MGTETEKRIIEVNGDERPYYIKRNNSDEKISIPIFCKARLESKRPSTFRVWANSMTHILLDFFTDNFLGEFTIEQLYTFLVAESCVKDSYDNLTTAFNQSLKQIRNYYPERFIKHSKDSYEQLGFVRKGFGKRPD